MMTRRDAIGSFAVLLDTMATQAHAQTPAPASPSATVFQHDLPNLTMEGWEVNVNAIDYQPGRVGSPHRHPGFTLVYVLEGAVVAKVSGQQERTFKAGEMFYEPPGSVHEVSKNASQTRPAKLLALNFAQKGLPRTMPA
jgi:quercetin dioxygenase-like cupin family protein